MHRLRRLPDDPHRIARGVAAGMFCNFPPLFGVQMLSAALLAWAFRGNMLAAVLATFVSNPLTTPLIALGSIELGHLMLGTSAALDFNLLVQSFTQAGTEIWHNIVAVFTGAPSHWYRLEQFFGTIFLPYVIGSLLPGIVVSVGTYYLSLPLIVAYQRLRDKRRADRIDLRRSARAMAEAEAADWTALAEPVDTPSAPPPASKT